MNTCELCPQDDESSEVNNNNSNSNGNGGVSPRAALFTNLAAVYATQGEIEQARQCALQAVHLAPQCPKALLALVYVELKRGDGNAASALLKSRRPYSCIL